MTNTKKVAIVTGASRGIGAAIAKRLGLDGFCVVVNYAHSDAEARAVVSEIESAGGTALAIQADVANAAAVSTMFEETEARFGKVTVLVNNAGIMKLKPIGDIDAEHINTQIDINLKGTLNTLCEASNRLAHGGRIINFSTSVVGLKLENYGVYAATKAAVETLTAIMAKEMRGRDITVNAIAPGPTATDLFLDGKSDALIDNLKKMNPMQRLGTPEDIAAAVSFLAGKDGAWINGQTIRANGGMV